ncbi:MAG: hypothetical protein J6X79_04930 [Bacteroidales bacterium]|nr:hypothetical protein [Bacteroidales bacterium]
MKRIAIIVVMALMTFTASASSIRYFTYAQASRTVQYLNAQQELMIYCGYDYEIETYVLVNEVWMERINSAYYELWIYGYDAYTGDEIYMPLDLQCVWLYSAGRMYNAAQYLRFHATVNTPSFRWYIPPYNPYTRRAHMAGYVRSYHYDIHRHGWMPPTPPHHGYGPHTQAPLPPYYMRTPQTPAPAPTQTWTPGLEHPQVGPTTNRNTSSGRTSVPTTRSTDNDNAGSATIQRNSGAARTVSTRDNNDNGNTRGTTTRSSDDNGTSRTTTTRSSDDNGTSRTTTTRGTSTTPTRTNTGTTRSAESGSSENTGTTRTGSSTRSTGTTTTRSTGTTTRSGGTTTRQETTTSKNRTSGTSRTGNTAERK